MINERKFRPTFVSEGNRRWRTGFATLSSSRSSQVGGCSVLAEPVAMIFNINALYLNIQTPQVAVTRPNKIYAAHLTQRRLGDRPFENVASGFNMTAKRRMNHLRHFYLYKQLSQVVGKRQEACQVSDKLQRQKQIAGRCECAYVRDIAYFARKLLDHSGARRILMTVA